MKDSKENTESVGDKAKKGMFLSVSSKLVAQVIKFIGMVILARILFPEDYGIMGLAMIFIEFAKRLSNFGFTFALLKKKEIKETDFSTVFVANIFIGTFFCILLYVCAPFIGEFFDNGLLGKVLTVISIDFLIQAFISIPTVILEREMRYGDTSIVNIIGMVVNIIVAISMAVLGFGVWSLVISKLVNDAVQALLLAIFSKWKPSIKYDHVAMKSFFSFGMMMFVRNQLNYFSNNVDYFIIGKLLGPVALGFYEKAFNIMMMPQKRIAMGMDSVLFTTFSKMQSDTKRLARAFKKVFLGANMITYPLMIGMILVAPYFIEVALGKKWIGSITTFQVLCVAGMLKANTLVTISICIIKNAIKKMVIYQAVYVCILAVACYIGVKVGGIVGVAAGIVVAELYLNITFGWLIMQRIGLKLSELLSPFLPLLVHNTMMILSVKLMEVSLNNLNIGKPVTLSLMIIVGGFSYCASLFIFKFEIVELLLAEIIKDIKRSLSKRSFLPNFKY